MNKFFQSTLLLLAMHFGFLSNSASAQSTVAENTKSVAKKDYVSAQAKILQDYKYATEQCSKRTGPAENACEIQARAKREADEEEARRMVDRAGYTPPLPDQARKKASDDARTSAKDDYKLAIDKVMQASSSAAAECSKLHGSDRKTCSSDVAARTADGKRRAKYNYARDVERAKAITVP